MTIIKPTQQCQAFDPMMILPEKCKHIVSAFKVNTGCVAPASLYIEGTHGNRFLCDYHYVYEKDITTVRTPELWPFIAKMIIDERNEIAKIFYQGNEERRVISKICWCGGEAFVSVIPHQDKEYVLNFCNFHYRKTYYRYYSNNKKFEDEFNIIDDRRFMSQTVIEEAESLRMV
jgi:hypothetical protein